LQWQIAGVVYIGLNIEYLLDLIKQIEGRELVKKAGKHSTISTENEVEKEEGGRGLETPLYYNKESPSSSHSADRDSSAILEADKTGVPLGTPRGISPLEEGAEKPREMTACISSQFPDETWSFRQ